MKRLLILMVITLASILSAICQENLEVGDLNPEFVKYMQKINSGEEYPLFSKSGLPLGEIPCPSLPNFDAFYENKDQIWQKNFPSVYDLRTLNLVTPVKNQGNCGSCWAFATYGSIESMWKKAGMSEPDLSEDNLNNCHSFDIPPCDGGNAIKASAYLTRLSGPVSEADDIYSGTSGAGDCPQGLSPVAYIFDSRFLPNDADVLKQSLIDWGALNTNMRWEDEYYNPSNYTYYYQGHNDSTTNHAITLVGWDDSKVTNGGTGVWILKNSWGTIWPNGVPSDSGYFYISYNDPKVNSLVAYFPFRINPDPNIKIYGYDEFGYVNKIGYNNSEAFGLIKFTSTRKEEITKVILFTKDYNTNIDIELYDNFDGTSLSGLLSGLFNQTCDLPGHHSFDLPAAVSRDEGEDFYIKVKYSTDSSLLPIPVEQQIIGKTSNAVIESGVCWKSNNGTEWTLIGNNTLYPYDLCIKAFTYHENKIAEMEYFINQDPGFGNGTSIPIPEEFNTEALFNFPLEILPDGIHVIYIRTKDENGKWSHSQHQAFYRFTWRPVINVVEMEYFFDNDPGIGNGNPITVSPASNIEKYINIPLASLTTGIHTLYLRVKDNYGSWSICESQSFYRYEARDLPDITKLEYFFDTDPGFGNGNIVNVPPATNIETLFNLDLDDINKGLHMMYIRSQNTEDKWGHCQTITFYNTGTIINKNIVSLEYFFDNDPGFGNGILVSVNPGQQIDEIFQIDLNSLTSGQHTFYIRAKDNTENWSLIAHEEIHRLELKVLFEGPYNLQSGFMDNHRQSNDLIPFNQPYNSDQNAVWYYAGGEYVTSILNEDIVDWILIQVRDASSPSQANGNTIKSTRAAFINKNGNICEFDGSNVVLMNCEITQNMYVVLYHLNHLGVMSSEAVPITGADAGKYDFTTSFSKYYGGTAACIELTPGIWGMISGDGDGNGLVNINDKNNNWAQEVGSMGYRNSDFNLNTQVDNQDKLEYWLKNFSRSCQIPD